MVAVLTLTLTINRNRLTLQPFTINLERWILMDPRIYEDPLFPPSIYYYLETKALLEQILDRSVAGQTLITGRFHL